MAAPSFPENLLIYPVSGRGYTIFPDLAYTHVHHLVEGQGHVGFIPPRNIRGMVPVGVYIAGRQVLLTASITMVSSNHGY